MRKRAPTISVQQFLSRKFFNFTYSQFLQAKPQDRLPCQCQHCGKILWLRKSTLTNKTQCFCNARCYYQHRGLGAVECECPECGKKIKKVRSEYNASELNFCSCSCRMKYYRRKQTAAKIEKEIDDIAAKENLTRQQAELYHKKRLAYANSRWPKKKFATLTAYDNYLKSIEVCIAKDKQKRRLANIEKNKPINKLKRYLNKIVDKFRQLFYKR